MTAQSCRRSLTLALGCACLCLLAGATHPVLAQDIPASDPSSTTQSPTARPGIERISLTAGRSTVISTDFEISRIAVTNPEVADAVVVEKREVLIDAKRPGTVSLTVWGTGRRVQYDLVVDPGITPLQQHFQSLFPGEDIRVGVSDEAIILSGRVSSTSVMLRAAEVAQATSSKSRVVNMLQLPVGMDSQQVMLQVRFAEVNRRALTELGVSLLSNRAKLTGRSTTQQFAAPDFDDSNPGGLEFSDFLNLFLFNREEGVGAVIKALKAKGYFQSLAEPNLIAYNGQEASFLAGGEFPVPVVQGATGTVTIIFKEFGVRLSFKPTIAGDTIRLRVRPEVSSLDFNNGITLEGFRVPALTTRRADTEVELKDGQSFAIAGLLNNISQEDRAKIPLLGDLPIIGYLFKSKAERTERTELMVLITPRLVKPLNPDQVPPLPTSPKPFLPPSESLGRELEGGGGLVDAPPVETPAVAAKSKKK